jgi:hypothetical protein
MLSEETPSITEQQHEDPRVAALQRELSEARGDAKYWAGLVRSNAAPAAAEAEPEASEEDENSEFYDASVAPAPIENDSPEKLIDEFASEGTKALQKRGFVTTEQAQRMAVDAAVRVTNTLIGRTTNKMSTDNRIMSEFPDLGDQDSELFKETAKRYQRAVAIDPAAKKTPAALYLAAEGARDALRSKSRHDPDAEDESDRRRRVDAQDSRPRGRATSDDGDDMLGNEAREVIRAMGITEAEFKASRKETAAKMPAIRRGR